MARTRKRTTQRPSKPAASSGGLSVLLSFFIGYAIAHVFDINFIGHQLDQLIDHDKQPKNQQEKAKTRANLPKPKFEYYSLLKHEGHHHKKPGDANKHSAIQVSQANPLAPIKPETHQYLLQLASYHKKEDAEKMKAELILDGHQANIVPTKTDNRIIYRIMIGPFKRKTEAEKEQVDLARQLNVMGMIRRTQTS